PLGSRAHGPRYLFGQRARPAGPHARRPLPHGARHAASIRINGPGGPPGIRARAHRAPRFRVRTPPQITHPNLRKKNGKPPRRQERQGFSSSLLASLASWRFDSKKMSAAASLERRGSEALSQGEKHHERIHLSLPRRRTSAVPRADANADAEVD